MYNYHNLIFLIGLLVFFGSALACQKIEPRYNFKNTDIYLKLEKSNGLEFTISRGSKLLQSIKLDRSLNDGYSLTPATSDNKIQIVDSKQNVMVTFELTHNIGQSMIVRVSRNLNAGQIVTDCINLEIGKLNWFGGAQNIHQFWPTEKSQFTNYSYISKSNDNSAVSERYWLNSRGVFIYVEPETPLFIDQNSEQHPNQLCFIAEKKLPYDIYEKTFTFSYKIGIDANAKRAHLLAVNKLLKKPSGHPNKRMVQYPIWSTWAPYKTEVNDSIVREFADNVVKYKFENSQIEIDDDWEDCYGALTFRKNKFPDIKKLTSDLKEKGFRVTLWIHPFINKNCTAIYNEALEKKFLVLNHNGSPNATWWNSIKNDAAYIDFTKPEAVEWFSKRLQRLKTEDGIDSFKFDAGEANWAPEDPVLNGPTNLSPGLLTSQYVRAVAAFGDVVEVRAAERTQDLPIFLRMLDKDTNWSWNNGLPTLLTTLMQLNMAGYPFVLPDMIGGNGYNKISPDREIFIRWLQANVFMPSLQFSFTPWMYDDEIIDWSLKYTKQHDDLTDYIMERFKLAMDNGDPVNPPIWWVDSDDTVASQIYDEFMLGDKYLVAPVIVKGQVERDIYLPKGSWIDGNEQNIVHKGPKWLMSYNAPLNVLPYFIKKEN